MQLRSEGRIYQGRVSYLNKVKQYEEYGITEKKIMTDMIFGFSICKGLLYLSCIITGMEKTRSYSEMEYSIQELPVEL